MSAALEYMGPAICTLDMPAFTITELVPVRDSTSALIRAIASALRYAAVPEMDAATPPVAYTLPPPFVLSTKLPPE